MLHRQVTKCGDSPNCVSSVNEDSRHHVEPIPFSGSETDACQKIQNVLSSMDGSQIVESEGGYIHAEFKTKLLGFVDDVEFYVDEPTGKIEVHSESRTGYYDFGVNRRRVEEIRHRLME